MSMISIIITIIFSRFQVLHNKNSVRPISSIQFSDYEDKIGVELQNVGTGPLTIKRLYFKRGGDTYSSLIEMMPIINQYWSTYAESVDGWTIAVGGQIRLLEIDPETEQTKRIVRNSLQTITAYVEYTDIYNTMFYDERSFSFFGRLL